MTPVKYNGNTDEELKEALCCDTVDVGTRWVIAFDDGKRFSSVMLWFFFLGQTRATGVRVQSTLSPGNSTAMFPRNIELS
jgi:hypothetical protein